MGFKHSWCFFVMKMNADQIRCCLHDINVESARYSVTISSHASDPPCKHFIDVCRQKLAGGWVFVKCRNVIIHLCLSKQQRLMSQFQLFTHSFSHTILSVLLAVWQCRDEKVGLFVHHFSQLRSIYCCWKI